MATRATLDVTTPLSSPASTLRDYLHAHIPLSAAMAVEVVGCGFDELVLRAPLAPNINHRETVFGGSATALAILACWSLLHVRLQGAGSRLVIQRHAMEFGAPIAGDFLARTQPLATPSWEAFHRTLARRGKARIEVAARLEYDGASVGQFSGEFVALSQP